MTGLKSDLTLSNVWDRAQGGSRRTSPIIERYLKRLPDTAIGHEIRSFIIDKQAQRNSHHTTRNYLKATLFFAEYLQAHRGITQVTDIKPLHVRLYMISLDNAGHNEGGVHNLMRPIKTFLRWYREEYRVSDADWPDPLHNIILGKPKAVPLEPTKPEEVERMINGIEGPSFMADRDRAILKSLFETGCRASEFLAANLDDLDLSHGQILIRWAKGAKWRTVFLSHDACKLVNRMLHHRRILQSNEPIWITFSSQKRGGARRLTYAGLRQITRRRASEVGMPEPGLHNFRRGFAVECLRQGVDLETVRRLLGHEKYDVIERYLKLVTDDLRRAHDRAMEAIFR